MAASDHLHPQQLKMFMSPREIMSTHQPMDADRENLGGGSSSGDFTHDSNWPNQTARRWNTGGTERTSGGSKLYQRAEMPETDDQVWERKAEEASDYGLTDEIRDEGVQHPVRLSNSMGDSGKPMVVGGHHRIAAQNDIDPDALMPVMHDRNFFSAKQDKYYRYR